MRNISAFSFWVVLCAVPVFAEQAETKGFTFNSQIITNTQSLPEGALVAFDQTAQVSKNLPQAISLNGGTVGKTQTAMTFIVLQEPQHGTLDVSGLGTGLVTYTPAPDFEGQDTFQFTVDAGGVAAKPATVTLQVVPSAVPAPPAAVPASGGGLVTDPFTLELNKKSDEFFKEQQRRRNEFFQDLRQKDLTSEEEQDRILDFRADEIEKEQKFRQRRQNMLDKQGEDSFLEKPDKIADDIALFFKLREPSIEELNKQRDTFLEKERKDRTEFFRDLQDRGMDPEEKVEAIREYNEKALEKRTKFFEKRREIITKQAQDTDLPDPPSDDEVKDEIVETFKELL
jgi:hypothetical protein